MKKLETPIKTNITALFVARDNIFSLCSYKKRNPALTQTNWGYVDSTNFSNFCYKNTQVTIEPALKKKSNSNNSGHGFAECCFQPPQQTSVANHIEASLWCEPSAISYCNTHLFSHNLLSNQCLPVFFHLLFPCLLNAFPSLPVAPFYPITSLRFHLFFSFFPSPLLLRRTYINSPYAVDHLLKSWYLSQCRGIVAMCGASEKAHQHIKSCSG